MAQFRLLSFVCENRPTKDVLGNVLQSQPIQPGLVLKHWADPELATAWFQRAKALLTNADRLAKVNAAPNFGDYVRNTADVREQWLYVLDVMGAIANAYNALNMIWYSDPFARALYRKYFSGLPDTSGGQTEIRLFGSPYDYRADWYTASQDTPVVGRGVTEDGSGAAGSHPFGKVSQSIIKGFRQFYPRQSRINAHPIDLVFSSMLVVTTPQGLGVPDVDTALAVQNGAFAEARNIWLMKQAPRPAGEPFAARYPDFPLEGCVYSGATGPVLLTQGVPGGNNWLDDWRCVYFNQAQEVAGIEATDEQLGAATGLSNYVPWLSEIVDAALSRTPQQIIQDERAFVVYENDATIRNNNGLDSVISQILGSNVDVYRQQTRYQGVFTAVGATAAGVGAALAPSTYGISALIGGAVALTAQVAGTQFRANFTGHGRDDLGRLKPLFDRGWLSGNPAIEDPNQGAPSVDVPDPPGWTRSTVGVGNFLAPFEFVAAIDNSQNNSQNNSQSTSNGPLIAGFAIALGLGYVLLKKKD